MDSLDNQSNNANIYISPKAKVIKGRLVIEYFPFSAWSLQLERGTYTMFILSLGRFEIVLFDKGALDYTH